MAVQKLLIRFILEPLSGITGKLGEKGRQGLFLAAGTCIFIYFFLNHMNVIRWRYLYSFALCSVLLGTMILATLPRKIQPVKFNPLFMVCWFGVSGLMCVSGLINNTDYLSEALLLLVAYPVIYICWNNQDKTTMLRLLLKLTKISLVVFFAASFLFAQITAKRFGGIFTNVNNCASYLALAGVCLLVELFYAHGSVKRNIVNVLLFGMCYGMIELTNSRTGKLALLCAGIVGVALYCVSKRFRIKKRIVFCFAGCILASLVMSTCLLTAFQARQYLPLPYYDRINHSLYFVGNHNQRPNDGVDNPGTDDPGVDDPGVDNPGDVEVIDPDSFDDLRDDKNNTEGKTFDQFSSGRLSIWKQYLQRLKLFGVEKKEPVYLESYKTYINTGHMTILEIAYESGIFAGIFYLLVNLLSGVLAIMYAWKHREEKFALMPLMVILAFGVVSITSSVNSSYNYALTFYYYLVLFPLVTKEEKSLVTR
jgi:hypothetical protein